MVDVGPTTNDTNLVMYRVIVPGGTFAVSFQPISLASGGTAGPAYTILPVALEFCSVKWSAIKQAEHHQVCVHRVGVNRRVDESPYLGAPQRGPLGDWVHDTFVV